MVLVLFVLSGALALGYQVLWSKYLLDFIGVSAYSYATVLAAFMGGLALGSASLGRLADRVRSPLRLYAYLETAVGLYALLYVPLAGAAARLYSALVVSLPEGAGAGVGLWAKLAVSALLLLLPTALMGGTYPALVRHATEELRLVGRRAAQLYAANALGAVLGALGVAFVLMPSLGMRRTLLALGLGSALVAAAALLLARRARGAGPPAGTAVDAASPAPPGLPGAAGVRLVLVLILLEGFVAFALEIAWTRFFALVLGSSTYSFALMLAAFISGIAVGSAWLARRAERVRDPLRLFGWTQGLAGVAVIAPLPLYPYAPWLFMNYGSLFSQQPAAFLPYEAGKLLLCALVMLPATVLIGMAVPLAVKAASLDLERLGRDTGRVYAWNTTGNVAGALAAGLALLPLMGTEGLLRGCGLASLALGMLALLRRPPAGARARIAALGILGLAAAFLPGRWQTEWFALNPSRRLGGWFSHARARELVASQRTLLFEDDPAAHLMVHARKERDGTEVRVLSVNGKYDASSVNDMHTQLLSAHLPLLLAPRPERVLVVGLASGITSGAVLTHPVRGLDVVEIVGAMPRASRLFREWNGDPFGDPRFRLVVDDARSYLSHTRASYDVIISEPSNPWTAGTGALFSRDFYARAAAALRPGGVYLQWLQVYEMGDATFAACVRSFRRVFPKVYVFQGARGDLLMIGAREPLRPDWTELRARFERPDVRRSLSALGIRELPALLAFQRLSPASVDFIASLGDQENDDDNRLLEQRSPRELFARVSVELDDRLDERLHAGPALFWRRAGAPTGAEAARSLLAAIGEPRARVEPVAEALELAAWHVQGGDPPLDRLQRRNHTPESLAAAVGRLLDAGRGDLAGDLLDVYGPALLLESALSPERADFWLARSSLWVAHPLRPERVRAFRIDLLAAVDRVPEAAGELDAWRRETPGPPVEWVVLRACELDPGALCDATIADALDRDPAPSWRRLAALRGF